MFLKFSKLINGKVHLKKAFWLYGNIYPFIIALIIILTIILLQENIEVSIVNQKFMNIGFLGKLIISIQGLLFFVYTTFATIGVWKSANAYDGGKIWVYLSKTAILYAYYSYIQNALYLYNN
jgi:hypothetical protein